MKKYILIFFCSLVNIGVKAQIVFCPPGAEWRYNFTIGSNMVANESIRYDRDTTLGGDVFKVLYHTRTYSNCNSVAPYLTLIRQGGDTVLFRSERTQHTWQILYNFDLQPGQGWQTSFQNITSGQGTHFYIIDSIRFVKINGKNLKRLYMGMESITERIGWNSFLFRFYNSDCEGDVIAGSLCYQDNDFGLKQFTELDCDFEGAVPVAGVKAIERLAGLKVFPNPVSGNLKIELEMQQPLTSAELCLVNVLGEKVLTFGKKTVSEIVTTEFNMANLPAGIYFVQMFNEDLLLATKKIIKE